MRCNTRTGILMVLASKSDDLGIDEVGETRMTKHFKEMTTGEIQEVAEAIRRGGVVVFKTDTVYGIGANALDERACERIYEIKQRPKYKPLSVLITNETMLREMVEEISPVERDLMERFWPGALTILLKKKRGVLAKTVASGTEYVGFRLLGKGSLAYNLIEAAGVPVVAPSANLSGSPTGVRMEKIREELDGQVDYIIDEGDVEDETTSTIVQAVGEEVVMIREGKIGGAEIERYLDKNS